MAAAVPEDSDRLHSPRSGGRLFVAATASSRSPEHGVRSCSVRGRRNDLIVVETTGKAVCRDKTTCAAIAATAAELRIEYGGPDRLSRECDNARAAIASRTSTELAAIPNAPWDGLTPWWHASVECETGSRIDITRRAFLARGVLGVSRQDPGERWFVTPRHVRRISVIERTDSRTRACTRAVELKSEGKSNREIETMMRAEGYKWRGCCGWGS